MGRGIRIIKQNHELLLCMCKNCQDNRKVAILKRNLIEIHQHNSNNATDKYV